MQALITGVTGFIGQALACSLVGEGWNVRVLIRSSSMSQLPGDHSWEVVEGDLLQPETYRAAFDDCDVVVHAAAIRNRWGTPPGAYHAVNVAATRQLIAAAIGRAQRFVYVSSVGVFGRPGVAGIDENFPVRVAKYWDYHSTKAEAERVVQAASAEIETVIVRPTITYGPGDADGMVTRLIEMIAGRRFIRIGSEHNHVHLIYISDLVAGLRLCMTHPAAIGQTFILSGPESIEIGALVALIEQRLGVRLPGWRIPVGVARIAGWGMEQLYRLAARSRVIEPDRAPLITRDKVDNLCVHRSFSSRKATQMLGFHPQINYLDGLSNTFKWLIAEKRV